MRKHYVLGAILVLLALSMGGTHAVADEPLEVTLVKLTSPVRTGDQVTFTIKTAAGAECGGTIRFRQSEVALTTKTAGEGGTATWSWRVQNASAGSWPIDVVCKQGDKRGRLTVRLEVR
jgi:hypothetical protein